MTVQWIARAKYEFQADVASALELKSLEPKLPRRSFLVFLGLRGAVLKALVEVFGGRMGLLAARKSECGTYTRQHEGIPNICLVQILL